MSGQNEYLKSLIQDGSIEEAINEIREIPNYHEAESAVSMVLREEKPASKLLEAVFQTFLDKRENRYGKHGSWVHSLSHFVPRLWNKRLDSWIKKFYEVAFRGADELDDSNCCERLIGDFGHFAKWDDDPSDFHLVLDNLEWVDWKYYQYAKARIEVGLFDSEEALLRWKLKQPQTHVIFNGAAQMDLVDVDEIRKLINEIQKIGGDISEFSSLEKDLLTQQLEKLENDLPNAEHDFQRERIEKGIQKTREALEA